MDSLANDYAARILKDPDPPCLSLYQPTNRAYPDKKQDPIRFRNLVKTLEESLREKYSSRDAGPLLEPFHALARDEIFWDHTLDGLAVLGSPGLFRVYRLQRPVNELAIVADSFHIKPLLRIVQSADRFHVLGLNRHAVRLFEGNRDVLDEVELTPDARQTIDEVLEMPRKEPHSEVWSPGSGPGVRHGAGSRTEELDSATERFFRAADRAILEHYSAPSRLPLILAALPEHHGHFRRISHNPYLLKNGIDVHPDDMTIEELRARAWQILEPHYLERLAGLIEIFGAAQARELASDDLATVANAAVGGRVATLLIDADRREPGRIDRTTGRIEFDDLADPEVDDLLDDIGELVLNHGGQVVIVPSERMPTRSGIAAIYRY